ncbi:hypothetical protein ColLi_13990 [Colletotrichum liriopes]|uniref:Uncharacterized protein n=1 Tax=Colletotrichum liriopes TaxID=708192 RepID=A0AA37M012_9PEZI|nr:hypothetical protein ColLi_13990 [Colletotrichum liriopes]
MAVLLRFTHSTMVTVQLLPYPSSQARANLPVANSEEIPPTNGNALATDMASLHLEKREEITGPWGTADCADVDRRAPTTAWRPAPQLRGLDQKGIFPQHDASSGQDEAAEYSRQELENGYCFYKEVYRPNKRRQQAKGEEQ